MDIIFSREVAEDLSQKYVILELEPHIAGENILESFCVIPSEKIPLTETVILDHWKKLHREFVQANKEKNGKLCSDLAEYLRGKWGGELDEFYDIVCDRYKA
jgi:hypothetical protein